MPNLVALVVLLMVSTPSLADSQRNQLIREHLETDTSTRLERIGQSLSGPCDCSEGEPLNGTHGLLFNCTCGSMQCVVAGSKNGAATRGSGFDLFCR